jgi:prepilin-type N-terminal cleavage/methylation domain-containing protein
MPVRHAMTRGGARGLTLVEIVIALSLAAIVLALVGSLFVASLSTWRRGNDLRGAQVQASTLVEMMARDIRGGSQAPGIEPVPAPALESGEPVLSVLTTRATGAGAQWVVYARLTDRREVTRQTLAPGPDGRLVAGEARVVATGVEHLTVERVGDGVTIEVRVRRGRDAATGRTTAAPRNP